MKNIAVILAGGRGTRAGGGIPKQFRTLEDGRTVFETCIAAFEQNEHIDEIAVVMLEEYMQQAKGIAAKHPWTKLRHWIPGGSERWESTLHAVEAINGKLSNDSQLSINCPIVNCPIVNLLIHDCARPFISQALITKVCEALETHEAVSVAVPVTDTIYVVENSSPKVGHLESGVNSPPKVGGVPQRGEGVWLRPSWRGLALAPEEYETVISEVPSRAVFRRAQTPQAFRLSVLKEAYSIFNSPPETGTFEAQWASMVAEDCEARRGEGVDPPLHATDDAGVVRYCLPDIPIHIVPGEESNRKLTFAEDF